jgi:hypothetical protein
VSARLQRRRCRVHTLNPEAKAFTLRASVLSRGLPTDLAATVGVDVPTQQRLVCQWMSGSALFSHTHIIPYESSVPYLRELLGEDGE